MKSFYEINLLITKFIMKPETTAKAIYIAKVSNDSVVRIIVDL